MRIIHDMGEGAHKLGRVFLAAVTTVVTGWVIIQIPDIPLEKLMMIVSVPSLYIGIKGRGYQPNDVEQPSQTEQPPAPKNPVTELLDGSSESSHRSRLY